ncbi:MULTISPECIES: hypothetical protein [Streptomyces]|uniref:Uncharacterized protein n=1 Tax=Streptomyces dengpaensis TaxID=2049881 RepID=A0ABM6T409_9ACTN|nr:MULTISPECIES: hypothetical protein [Streptomyces]AVH61838.1 hypothetical protein C4B68_40740 [Streptomyces dengpaensis]PIB04542.1 hypothetical protein B1C81_32730 [Streptomyces sp. HG99]
MALTTLFARRPAVLDTATWTPDGTTVVQRYRGAVGEREGAIVLVYTADGDRGTSSFATACLGCTYRAVKSSHSSRLAEKEAADLANTHAASCRAMDRGIPAAPDDDQAAQIVRARLQSLRMGGTNRHYVYLSDFHADRVDLQRPADFIKMKMLRLVQDEPDFLVARPTTSGTGTQFLVLPHPPRN